MGFWGFGVLGFWGFGVHPEIMLWLTADLAGQMNIAQHQYTGRCAGQAIDPGWPVIADGQVYVDEYREFGVA